MERRISKVSLTISFFIFEIDFKNKSYSVLRIVKINFDLFLMESLERRRGK